MIERLKNKFGVNEPIFTSEIINEMREYSRPRIFQLIKQAVDEGTLVRFDKGVYYIPTKSIIGASTITVEDVVGKKYIGYDNEVYGVYGGLNLQNLFSVTTQMPNAIEIVSNNESTRCRKFLIDGRTVIVRKARCEIDRKNAKAYTVLQLLSDVGNISYLDEETKSKLFKYIRDNNINTTELMSLLRVFPARTTKNLIYSGVINEFTRR